MFSATDDVVSFRLSCLEELATDPSNDVASYQAWLADTELKRRMKYWSMLDARPLLESYLKNSLEEDKAQEPKAPRPKRRNKNRT